MYFENIDILDNSISYPSLSVRLIPCRIRESQLQRRLAIFSLYILFTGTFIEVWQTRRGFLGGFLYAGLGQTHNSPPKLSRIVA